MGIYAVAKPPLGWQFYFSTPKPDPNDPPSRVLCPDCDRAFFDGSRK